MLIEPIQSVINASCFMSLFQKNQVQTLLQWNLQYAIRTVIFQVLASLSQIRIIAVKLFYGFTPANSYRTSNLWTRPIIYTGSTAAGLLLIYEKYLKTQLERWPIQSMLKLYVESTSKNSTIKHIRETTCRYLLSRCILNCATVWLLKCLLCSSAGAWDCSFFKCCSPFCTL